ncbi:glycosyltransferase [Candidatus Pelagibacter sp.]|nr:glycosyltransferase [Candidatus Pelagibacter sp.]
MKIGIVSRGNVDDRVYWSGLINVIYHYLKKNKKIKVFKIDKLNNTLRKFSAVKREYLKFFKNEKYDESYNITVSKNFARQIEKKLKNKSLDYILAFDLSLVAYLKTKVPIILWTDLLYSDYYSHYFKKQKISNQTTVSIKILERKAIQNSFKIILSTKWALNKAKKKYKSMSNKFKQLQFGPSFYSQVNKKKILNTISNKSKKKLSLITLGVSWKRKGLKYAIELNKLLNKKKINSQLTIIGISNKKISLENVKLIKFINKNNVNGEKKISNYLLKNHFHILFSNAEAYGLANIEANSRGIPNICFNVGGIKEIIKNNINGLLYNKSKNLNLIANDIIKLFKNNKKYKKLARSSYEEYRKNFNFEVIILKFINLIQKQ